ENEVSIGEINHSGFLIGINAEQVSSGAFKGEALVRNDGRCAEDYQVTPNTDEGRIECNGAAIGNQLHGFAEGEFSGCQVAVVVVGQGAYRERNLADKYSHGCRAGLGGEW